MRQNEKMICKILNYIPKERKFEVEDYLTKKKGYVIFTTDYQDIPILKDAYKGGKNIPLYFDRYEGGRAIFSYREIIPTENIEEKKKFKITALFSSTDKEFNLSLFDAFYASIGGVIDTEEKYNLSKQLLLVNKELKIKGGLTKEFFKMATTAYQNKFWEEGVLPYYSNFGIQKMWSDSDEDGRNMILKRLGISLPQQNNAKIECFFENIGQEVIRNIHAAKDSIKIAVAWFTNFEIFKAIKYKLENSNVKIILVTNNDLINNGGYCLNFNELIDLGLKVYLYEYPHMLHHKFCIIDQDVIMTGSYNWTFFSEVVNRENMLVIKGDEIALDSFTKEFDYIISRGVTFNRMPESVPEKPEYDRSAFKQYISEELVIRTRLRIGNAKENINHAKILSPSYVSVVDAIQDLNISTDNDNTKVSIQALESVASTTAIEERREQIVSHQQRLQQLDTQRENLHTQQIKINQRQQEIQVQTQQLISNVEITEIERNKLQENLSKQEDLLSKEQEQINTTLLEVEQTSEELQQVVQQVQEEIATIEETSQVETIGGRGALKINLKWNTTDDLDLHVFDPSGVEIYYASKEHICEGVKGKLDVDANASSPYTQTPQENIFWEEGKNAPIGKYKVQVVLFNKRDSVCPIPFTITIYPDKGETKTFTGKAETIKTAINIVDFEYSENGIIYL